MEFYEDPPLPQSLKRKRNPIRMKKQPEVPPEEPAVAAFDHEVARLPATSEPPLSIALDHSVENHFQTVDKIAQLCGYSDTLDANMPEIQRFSNSVTFLREWRDFTYAPRTVRFANQHNSKEADVMGEITLNQFSATSVPKIPQRETGNESNPGTESSKDFVMYVGGSVWALDWCPTVNSNTEDHIKSEFVAVAAHPPESSYHEIGVPLMGRGAIQIWCLLTSHAREDLTNPRKGNPKRKPQKTLIVKPADPSEPKKPRGRPRKTPLKESVPPKKYLINDGSVPPRPRGRLKKHLLDDCNQYVQPLAIEYSVSSIGLHSSDGLPTNSHEHAYKEKSVNTPEDSNQTVNANVPRLTASKDSGYKSKARKKDPVHTNDLHILRQCENGEIICLDPLARASLEKDITCTSACDTSSSQSDIPIDVAFPRMMLCLAHNGKVAWDVKWRPVSAHSHHSESMHTMGYLAVLLGNGALEVWEVPLPHTVKLVYPACKEHIDPRFIKLKPVFRCSKLKCGDKQSIPLTMEWSVSSPNDMILAGCHDGMVALWKFSVTDSSTDTRPMLCFRAETCPIRTLAWAPIQSELEIAHVFTVAGNKGLKFWDIRDPFRPLRDYPIPGNILGVAWMHHQSSVCGVVDDGTLWLLNLEKAAQDIPVTGKCPATSRPVLSSYDCSSFALWSLQVSRLTGAAAYCGEEGTALCFQPTSKSAKATRYRRYHYVCGSLLEEGSTLVVASPSTDSPASIKIPGPKRPGGGVSKEHEDRAHSQIAICGNAVVEGAGPEQSNNKRAPGVESFPRKAVAMHKVRWNVNRGSERWLCYGGAAGLVRCQNIDPSLLQ